MNNEVKVVLFDTFESFENLLPLSYTRPVADFRVGIMTIREKWEHYLPGNYSYKTTEYLGEKFPVAVSADEEAVFVAGNVLPDEDLAARVLALESGGALRDRSGLVAFRGSLRQFGELDPAESSVEGDEVSRIQYVYDVFRENGQEICRDYDLLAKRGKGQAPDASVTIIGSVESSGGMPRIYIEDGAVVEGAVLNVKNGPIYIGKDAVVMEGACLRGPVALCDNAVVRMGAKVYGSTTIGPYCKVGGELDNAVMFGFSNKAHDGYLGNAVIGEWCNL
ncbi:MAG: glucose-1-phosphate thymidylyltransferase, partial [Muribaculaceae bacterium]|nr:glucose-1-phosphate thymidylyltransferase [Muribaculaceae bacterium]